MDVLGTLDFALSVIIGVFILVILVAMHEFGHGVVARRNGVRVKEFGIGFPPRAKGWNVKKSVLGKNVLYSLNWLPLGGFVQLQGENDAANKKGDYGAANFWVKTKILLAGVAVNWVTAVVLFTIIAFIGMPKLIEGQFMIASDTVARIQPVTVDSIVSGLPADKAGLKVGDELVSVAGVSIDNAPMLFQITSNERGEAISVVYKRDGKQNTVNVALRADNTDKKGYLGLGSSQKTTYRSTWSAPIVGIALTGQLTAYTLQSLGTTLANFVTGLVQKLSFDGAVRADGDAKLSEANNNVGGPLMIFGMLFPAARADGVEALLLVTALIALTLAVMNALPIPALDGGRWFVTFWYRKVLKKPLTREKEESIHGTGFMILMGLVLLITIADVYKFGG